MVPTSLERRLVALWTTASSPPKRSTAVPTAASTSAATVTSVRTKTALPPRPATRAAVSAGVVPGSGHHHVGPGLGAGQTQRPPDPGTSPGDEHHPSVQIVGHGVIQTPPSTAMVAPVTAVHRRRRATPPPTRPHRADPGTASAGSGWPGRSGPAVPVATPGTRSSAGHGHTVDRDPLLSPGSCGRLGQRPLTLGHRRPRGETRRADQGEGGNEDDEGSAAPAQPSVGALETGQGPLQRYLDTLAPLRRLESGQFAGDRRRPAGRDQNDGVERTVCVLGAGQDVGDVVPRRRRRRPWWPVRPRATACRRSPPHARSSAPRTTVSPWSRESRAQGTAASSSPTPSPRTRSRHVTAIHTPRLSLSFCVASLLSGPPSCQTFARRGGAVRSS